MERASAGLDIASFPKRGYRSRAQPCYWVQRKGGFDPRAQVGRGVANEPITHVGRHRKRSLRPRDRGTSLRARALRRVAVPLRETPTGRRPSTTVSTWVASPAPPGSESEEIT